MKQKRSLPRCRARGRAPSAGFVAALVGLLAVAALLPADTAARPKGDDEKSEGPWTSGTFSGLAFRNLGPAFTSGRIGDIAIDPRDRAHWYVAVSSGNVWETRNAGTTWDPIFDDQGSYSIGCLALDPTDPNVVWVGTGENNSQRSVSFGDGVYRSVDGGKTWQNKGLEESMHIGKIVIHPDDGDVVYVAAMGPLWGPGGDRGLYVTRDGGKNWERLLDIDQDTGVVDLAMDPGDPETLYAATYQRRRHVWTLIDGGPGSGIHKSTDGGRTWQKLARGLPDEHLGRIGLAVAPKRPDTIYAIIESVGDAGGFYRSTNAGASWQRMSDYVATSPQYYHEIVADPVNPDRVYSLDTFSRVSDDGGKTWRRLGLKARHVDDHALWIDPDRTDHLVIGGDGGVYETWDGGETWRFMANLPVTQFYKLALDNDAPIYNVYGGTQDNNTQGGPVRTLNSHGIRNSDWFVTLGGDGFEPAIDPTDPNIVYSQLQHGNLVRYDRQSGERIDIQPQPEPGESLRWNWDSALIISPHDPSRLYFAAQKIFRSDDRGHSWRKVSGDLSRGLDRNRLEVMGRVWSVDTVAKNRSTSFYGNIVALAESPLTEGVLYAGTDDGLVQVTRDGGQNWTRHEDFRDVPKQSYVACLTADRFAEGTVYACFDNRKGNDLKPYVRKSTDHGKSWQDITGDLPERGTAWSIVQDHVDPDLLFVGTEFGVFFTTDGGRRWVQLKAGIPTIACRDLEIQRRENDLVVATFGRGFYVLDDYTPLRGLTPADLEQPAVLFPAREAWHYVETGRLGGRRQASQGDAFYTADNPPFGAVFTYYLKEDTPTLKAQRRKLEQEKFERNEPVYYPSWDELRAEDREQQPTLVLTVRDAAGGVVRHVQGATGKGLHRVAWDLRYPSSAPITLKSPGERNPWDEDPSGMLAPPGRYSVTLARRVRGEERVLAGPVEFDVVSLKVNRQAADEPEAAVAFALEAQDLARVVEGTVREARAARNRIEHLRRAVEQTPAADRAFLDRLDALDDGLADLFVVLEGDPTVSRREEPTPPGVGDRVGRVIYGLRNTTMAPTQTMRDNLKVARDEFRPALAALRRLVEEELPAFERELDELGAPHTPGRLPTLQ
ncbi:MAG: glycosyl hydrolase [Candidatus Krumholzibacteriia bacterium]